MYPMSAAKRQGSGFWLATRYQSNHREEAPCGDIVHRSTGYGKHTHPCVHQFAISENARQNRESGNAYRRSQKQHERQPRDAAPQARINRSITAGAILPSKDGPSRMPAAISPITAGWPMNRNAIKRAAARIAAICRNSSFSSGIASLYLAMRFQALPRFTLFVS